MSESTFFVPIQLHRQKGQWNTVYCSYAQIWSKLIYIESNNWFVIQFLCIVPQNIKVQYTAGHTRNNCSDKLTLLLRPINSCLSDYAPNKFQPGSNTQKWRILNNYVLKLSLLCASWIILKGLVFLCTSPYKILCMLRLKQLQRISLHLYTQIFCSCSNCDRLSFYAEIPIFWHSPDCHGNWFYHLFYFYLIFIIYFYLYSYNVSYPESYKLWRVQNFLSYLWPSW